MKRLIILLTLLMTLVRFPASVRSMDILTAPSQAKIKYINIRINKPEPGKIGPLLNELRSYESKISDAQYDTNQHLIIYYTDQITLDDIYEIVLKHFSDIDKIGGTDL